MYTYVFVRVSEGKLLHTYYALFMRRRADTGQRQEIMRINGTAMYLQHKRHLLYCTGPITSISYFILQKCSYFKSDF